MGFNGIYPLVIQDSHAIDGPFIDGLPMKNGDFVPWQTVSHNQMVMQKR